MSRGAPDPLTSYAGAGADPDQIELSVVIPCLNEAETIGDCVSKARRAMHANDISGEIIVADNGSTDNSANIAVDSGARLVTVAERGYGSALMGGIEAARGTFIIMGER